MKFKQHRLLILLALAFLLAPARLLLCQTDQGTITGVVQDPTGAVIANASVTLTDLEEGQVLNSKTDGAGIYVFSPIKIGKYKVTASAPNFETTTQTNLQLSIQQRLNVVIVLKPGTQSETITVTTAAPLMQTQESSVGQTMDEQTIESVPLNGRNWVYIAQLSAGTTVSVGSRGQGKGDFEANGVRAEENDFVLDGVDNNANVVDFYNGASYVANPPPDALAEFKVQTSDYSAEFGHSAGAVVNASIKSGTNAFHGSAWEYVRNTVLDASVWNPNGAQPASPYHDNQFGATLGGPFLKNKLFFFGDVQATRIAYAEPGTFTVPTALERLGNLSELLNPSLTSDGNAHPVYFQTAGAPPQAFANNCIVTSASCTSNNPGATISQTALKILSEYPAPNVNGTNTYNNYYNTRPVLNNTFQWDARMDYNFSAKDTAYSRYSLSNNVGQNAPPLGNILDGGSFGDDGTQKIYAANFMFSETHIFTQTLTNEARFGFNYLHTGFVPPNAANLNFEASQGFGGIPVGPLNGGLPNVTLSGGGGLTTFGTPGWSTTDEHNDVYQIIDNVTKIAGSHSLKAGVSFQNIRFGTLQPQDSRGNYTYNGQATSNLAAGVPVTNSGSGIADFLLDLQNSAGLSNEVTNGDQRSVNGIYVQDDWRVKTNLTLNLGLRWDYFQPYQDVGGYQASFSPTAGSFAFNAATGYGSGKAQYLIPTEAWSYAQSIMSSSSYNPNFSTVLAKDGITPVSVADPHLLKAEHTNFAPRFGTAWSPDTKTVVRTGFGIFYGGVESIGYYPNLGENYPFQFSGNFPAPACGNNVCPTDGITIANGFQSIIANGFASQTTNLTLRGAEINQKTPYTEGWNLSVERSLGSDMVATASYVGNTGRHMLLNPNTNAALAITAPGHGTNNQNPFPDEGGTSSVVNQGMSDYNSLQTKIEKRMSHGYNLLATYTWSHALDDDVTPLNSGNESGPPDFNIVPLQFDYSQSPWDTRQRFTFNGLYELPFGKGRQFLNDNAVAEAIVGGWSANATFTAQSGNFMTINTNSISAPGNLGNRALQIGNPYAGGGSAPASNPNISCPASVKNYQHWFNPCAFANPWSAAGTIPAPGNATAANPNAIAVGSYITNPATVESYVGGRRNQIAGPGFERVAMSIFKSFPLYHENKLDFRADIFNLFNTPALANPSDTNINSNGGQITGTRTLQQYAPDSRFFQLSLRYAF
jgi:hypothetical protein